MQLISCELPVYSAVVFSKSLLGGCRVLPINKVRPITHLWRPVRDVGPQASALAIKRRVLIHAIVDPHIWQTLNAWPRLQVSRIGILHKPTARLQVFNDVAARLYQAIAALKIAWGLGCCSGHTVHSAVWGCPYCVKMARFICSSIIPCRNICLYLCAISTVPVYICDLPPCLSKRFAHRSCARAEEQSTRPLATSFSERASQTFVLKCLTFLRDVADLFSCRRHCF